MLIRFAVISTIVLAAAGPAHAQGVFDMQNAEGRYLGHQFKTVGRPTREVQYHGRRAYIINGEAICLLRPNDFASFSEEYTISGHVDRIVPMDLTNPQTGAYAGQRQVYLMSGCSYTPVTAANVDDTLNSTYDAMMGKAARSMGQTYTPLARASSGMRPTDRATEEQAALLSQHLAECREVRANNFNGTCFRQHKAELDADIHDNIAYNQAHGFQ